MSQCNQALWDNVTKNRKLVKYDHILILYMENPTTRDLKLPKPVCSLRHRTKIHTQLSILMMGNLESRVSEPDQIVGGYKIVTRVGVGAFADVYKAVDTSTKKTIALKRFKKTKMDFDDVLIEIEPLKKAAHKNVTQYIKSFNDVNTLYLVMEYCEFGTIDEFIKAKQPGNGKRFGLIKDIAAGIAHLHSLKIIHRDLKPANILIGSQYVAKLTDFGLAKILTKTERGAKKMEEIYMSTMAGTPVCMAPEVLDGHYNAQADIFSMGIVFCSVLDDQLKESVEKELIGLKYLMVQDYKYTVPATTGIFMQRLITGMLQKDYHMRPKAHDISTHLMQYEQRMTIIRRRILKAHCPDSEPEPGVCKKIFCQNDGRGVDTKIYTPCECYQDIYCHIQSFDKDVLPCGSNVKKRYHRLFGDDIPLTKRGDSHAAVCAPSTVEGIVDVATMQTIAYKMDLSWKRLGLRLGLSWSTIVKINKDHLPTAIFEMLFQWRNSIGSENHQARILYTALCDHGYNSLAVNLFVTDLYTESLSIEKQKCTDDVFKDQDLLFICSLLLDDAVASTAWRRLGVRLGLPWTRINNLANEHEKPDNIIKMLICWRDGHPHRQLPTMVNALKEQRLSKIAYRICKRHSYEGESEERSSKPLGEKMPTGYMHDMDIVFISEMINGDWKRLAGLLSMKKNELDDVLIKFPREIKDATVETLVRWRDRQERNDNHLTIVFDKLKMLRRHDIVVELQKHVNTV